MSTFAEKYELPRKEKKIKKNTDQDYAGPPLIAGYSQTPSFQFLVIP